METRAVTEMRTGTRMERGRGWDGDGNEEGIGEGGGDVKTHKKPHQSRRRDQAL